MKNRIEKQYYVLKMDDHAAPSCSSFPKLYVGTMEQIELLIHHLRGYEKTKEAFAVYCKGDLNATHFVAYQEVKLLEPVEVVHTQESTMAAQQWEHLNTWLCPYTIKFDEARVSQLVMQYLGRWCRCIRAWMKNLCYQNSVGDWTPADSGFWGLSGLLEVTNLPENQYEVNNRLYVLEEIFNDATAALDSFATIPPQLQQVCNEVFGNG